jgi:hypothetical protein
MRAIIIILSALGAAILVTSFLKSWQRRAAERDGVSSDDVQTNYILGAVVAIVVFAVGVIWLEADSAPPDSSYSPARIQNGAVTKGVFDAK